MKGICSIEAEGQLCFLDGRAHCIASMVTARHPKFDTYFVFLSNELQALAYEMDLETAEDLFNDLKRFISDVKGAENGNGRHQ